MEAPLLKKQVQILLSLFLILPLQGCISLSYVKYKYMNVAAAGVYVYGSKDRLKKYDVFVLMNDDSIDTSKSNHYSYFMDISNSADKNDESAVIYSVNGVCNSFNTGIPYFDCQRNESWENVTFTTVLFDRETFKSMVLDKSTFKLNAHYTTNLSVNAFFAADKDKCPSPYRYYPSSYYFQWDKAKPVYFPELEDSLYVYTEVKYSDEPHKGPYL